MGFFNIFAGMKCEDCGIERWKLHKHHVIPKSKGGTETIKICANCHEDRHGGPHTDSLPWQLGHTPEAKAKRSARMREVWESPSYRKRVLAVRALANTPEVNARRAASVSKALKGKPFTPEHLAAIRNSRQTPEFRAKMAARTHTQETKDKCSRIKKAWWAKQKNSG